MIILGAVLSLLALMPAGAVAAEWLLNGEPITTAAAVTSAGTLLLGDLAATGGEVAIVCEGTDKGTVGPEAKDEVTSMTATACTFESGKNGSCTASDAVTARAVHLPWLTLLVSVAEVTRDKLTGSAGAPGWQVECTVGGIIKVSDECTSANALPDVVNLASGVDTEFLATETAGCSLGTATSGMVIGSDLTKNPTGQTLSVGEYFNLEEVEEGKGGRVSITVTRSRAACTRNIVLENSSTVVVAIKINRESARNCTIRTRGCEGSVMNRRGTCTSELERPMARAEYEFEAEWNGRRRTERVRW